MQSLFNVGYLSGAKQTGSVENQQNSRALFFSVLFTEWMASTYPFYLSCPKKEKRHPFNLDECPKAFPVQRQCLNLMTLALNWTFLFYGFLPVGLTTNPLLPNAL